MEWLFTAFLLLTAVLLANLLPVDSAGREQNGLLHQRGWRENLTIALLVVYSYGAMMLGLWLFALLRPYYESEPLYEGYWVFFAVALEVAALYISAVSVTGRWLLRIRWAIAWQLAVRTALYNLLVLPFVLWFLLPH